MPGQSPRREPRRRRADRGNYRELIHLLNRRYHLEWERAERLAVELARARRWGLGPLIDLLRRVKRWLLPSLPDLSAGVLPWPHQPIIENPGRPQGRVSIIVPFKDRLELLRNCLSSLRLSSYRRFEVILVNNGSEEPRTQRYPVAPARGAGVCASWIVRDRSTSRGFAMKGRGRRAAITCCS